MGRRFEFGLDPRLQSLRDAAEQELTRTQRFRDALAQARGALTELTRQAAATAQRLASGADNLDRTDLTMTSLMHQQEHLTSLRARLRAEQAAMTRQAGAVRMAELQLAAQEQSVLALRAEIQALERMRARRLAEFLRALERHADAQRTDDAILGFVHRTRAEEPS